LRSSAKVPQGQHVRGRVEAGAEQEAAQPGQLDVGEISARQVAQQVVGRLGPLGEDQLVQVLEQGVDRRALFLAGAARAGEGERLALEEVVVRVRHAEQLADQQRRHGLGERHQQIRRRAVALHRVELLGRALLDPLGQPAHPADREAPGEQPPEPGVLRRVEPGHVSRRGRRHLRKPAGERVVRELVARAEPAVAEDRADHVVARREPADVPVRVGHPGHRAFGAQARQLGRRIERAPGRAGHGQGGDRLDHRFWSFVYKCFDQV
jgi:hypothetical protein